MLSVTVEISEGPTHAAGPPALARFDTHTHSRPERVCDSTAERSSVQRAPGCILRVEDAGPEAARLMGNPAKGSARVTGVKRSRVGGAREPDSSSLFCLTFEPGRESARRDVASRKGIPFLRDDYTRCIDFRRVELSSGPDQSKLCYSTVYMCVIVANGIPELT